MLPDWFADMTPFALFIVCVAWVLNSYINRHQEEESSIQLVEYLTKNTQTNTELLTMLRSQQEENRRNADKQYEALQSITQANHQLILLTRETFEQVKEISRRGVQ